MSGLEGRAPDVRGTIRGAVAGEDTVAQELLWEGTHTGPMETPEAPSSRRARGSVVEASLWARFEGGKAREVHHYLDVLTLLQQIGAIPRSPAGSPGSQQRRSRPWPGTRWAVRHLKLEQAAAALKRGKPVEQLLPSEPHDGQPTVRWLTMESSRDSFVVRLHHVYDEGSPDALPVDVSEFTPVDDDEYWGEGVKVARSPHPDGALGTTRDHGATNERWVNFGVIADEYSDARGWT